MDLLFYVLLFLDKIKKIAQFEILSGSTKVQFIKILQDKNDIVTEKDKSISSLLSHIDTLEKKINVAEKKINSYKNKAKELIKQGDKMAAKKYLIQTKLEQKGLENLQSTHNTLEQQIFDIKNAENNSNVTNILKKSTVVVKELSINPDDFAETALDIKEQKEALNEINTAFSEMADNNDEEIAKEMEKLMLEEKSEVETELPNPNKEDIIQNDVESNILNNINNIK